MAEVVMPQLGESVTEGTVSKWLVRVGDRVNKYDPICEVTTDKVVAEVPSTSDGTITQIVVQEGETVPVNSLICHITTGESIQPALSVEPAKLANPVQGQPIQQAAATNAPAPNRAAGQRFSPAVLKLAQEHRLDLAMIKGSGAGGRITRSDVLAIVESGSPQLQAAAAVQEAEAPAAEPHKAAAERAVPAAPMAGTHASMAAGSAGDQVIPVSSIRRTIASRMVQSKHDAPHAWMMIQCDVTGLVRHRSRIKEDFKKKEGLTLTYLPFFIKAVVEAIKEFPILNAQWAGDSIIVKKAVHISIAVATDDALFVPVIKDADQKSILGLAKAVEHLAAKCREGRLTMEDLSGGTFTVNNTGSFGSVLSAPIINQPQAAILSMESIIRQPVVIGDMIAIRDMMNICLSLDHRVLDGLVCGRFLQSVKQKIEGYGPDTKLY